MNKPSWSQGPPKTILQATDLSGRCDRAMDRAAHLANLWDARLVVLNVLEYDDESLEPGGTADLPSWRRPPEREAVVSAQVRRDLREDLKGTEIRVVEGAAAAYMRDKRVDLVVVGTHGRSDLFDVRLGGTAKRILKAAPDDILLIREPRSVRSPGPTKRPLKASAASD